MCSALLRRDDVTAAIVPKHLNGAEGLMALEHCATLVVFVSHDPMITPILRLTMIRLRKIDPQDGRQTGHD